MCTDYRQGASPTDGFMCLKEEGNNRVCVPAFKTGSRLNILPLAIQMLLHYCPSTDFSVCQNGVPPPAPPPDSPGSPPPPSPPAPPGKPPRSPKPSPPPGSPS